MALVPYVTTTDITDNFGRLLTLAGVSGSATTTMVNGAMASIRTYLGYEPQVDSITGLATVMQNLDGGRPSLQLYAIPDLTSAGSNIVVTEFSATLTRRTSFSVQPVVGDYYVDGYTLYRLAGSGSKILGIWGASTANSVNSFSGNTIGGLNQGADNTDQYRGVITATYNPTVDAALLKEIALGLIELSLQTRRGGGSVSFNSGKQTISSSNSQIPLATAKQALLSQLPRLPLLGTGT